MDGKGMTGLVVAITIGAVFFVPVVDVIDGSTGEVQVENETVTTNASFSETYELSGDNITAGSETIEVVNSDGTFTTLTAGTDYALNEAEGTLQFSDTTDVSAGDEIRASFSYQATSGIVTSIADLLPVFLGLLLLVPMANKIQEEM
jgi:hypothetical protein